MRQFLFYNEFIILLYMFRAQPCSPSGGQNCIIQHLASSHSAGGNLQSVMMPDAVWYNFDLLMMSTVVLETYTYLFTPWCRVLLEKLTGLQLVKKFPEFLWNPKVHYRTDRRPPGVPVQGQVNPVHIPTSHLLEILPNIIHTSTPRSPQWSTRV